MSCSCSVACYKQHKETCSSRDNYKPSSSTSVLQPRKEQDVVETRPTKRLKDLDWPEEPDDSLWTDPLSKTDIKPLRHIEYEAVGTPVIIWIWTLNADSRRTSYGRQDQRTTDDRHGRYAQEAFETVPKGERAKHSHNAGRSCRTCRNDLSTFERSIDSQYACKQTAETSTLSCDRERKGSATQIVRDGQRRDPRRQAKERRNGVSVSKVSMDGHYDFVCVWVVFGMYI